MDNYLTTRSVYLKVVWMLVVRRKLEIGCDQINKSLWRSGKEELVVYHNLKIVYNYLNKLLLNVYKYLTMDISVRSKKLHATKVEY